jgi:hypothetical protein
MKNDDGVERKSRMSWKKWGKMKKKKKERKKENIEEDGPVVRLMLQFSLQKCWFLFLFFFSLLSSLPCPALPYPVG